LKLVVVIMVVVLEGEKRNLNAWSQNTHLIGLFGGGGMIDEDSCSKYSLYVFIVVFASF
jgi:hypothetical protein